jgi:ABC-2 type transport system permease protein/lipopolysaccharide transport system permease protein
LWRQRGLLRALVGREIKARYRGSVLGFLWSLANPALLLVVYSIVFGLILPQRGVEPYALFLVTGLFPWIWLSTSLLEGSVAFQAHGALLRKAAFPAAILPMVPVTSNLVHFLLALPVVAGAFAVGRTLGYEVGSWPALLVPAVIALQIPFVAGLALGLGALNVHFKDMRDILANSLTLLFFLTPVLYPLDAIPHPALWWVVRLNPFTPFTLAYQQLLFFEVIPDPSLWLQMIVVGAAAWAVGTALFERLSDTLVEAV